MSIEIPAEKPLPLPPALLEQIQRELQSAKPDFASLKVLVQEAGADPDAHDCLVVPSIYPPLTARGAKLPHWLLLDGPAAQHRLVRF